MTTIVNTPPQNQDSGNGVAMTIGVVILVVFVYLLFVYGLPAIRGASTAQINIPDKVDVNVNDQTK